MSKTIRINGVDCTRLFKDKGYAVGEKKIYGGQDGIVLSGDQIEDLLSLKDTLAIPLEPLSETDVVFLMDILRTSQVLPYVEIYYFSTNYGTYREVKFIRDEITNSQLFIGNDGVAYYDENTLFFVEK